MHVCLMKRKRQQIMYWLMYLYSGLGILSRKPDIKYQLTQ